MESDHPRLVVRSREGVVQLLFDQDRWRSLRPPSDVGGDEPLSERLVFLHSPGGGLDCLRSDSAQHKVRSETIIPAESVYAVFEAKQTADASMVAYAQKKVESVRRLRRTSLPIP